MSAETFLLQLQSGALPTELSEVFLAKSLPYLILINDLTNRQPIKSSEIRLKTGFSSLTLTRVEVTGFIWSLRRCFHSQNRTFLHLNYGRG